MSPTSPVNRGTQLNTNHLTRICLAEISLESKGTPAGRNQITGQKFPHVKSPAQVTWLARPSAWLTGPACTASWAHVNNP